MSNASPAATLHRVVSVGGRAEEHQICCGTCRHYHEGTPNPWSGEPMDNGNCAYFSRRAVVPFWSRAYTVKREQGNGCKTWEAKE